MESESTLIGHIVDVSGSSLTINFVEDEQGSTPTVTIGDEDIEVGYIGSYVKVLRGGSSIIAMLNRISEQEVLAAPTIETDGESPARLPFARRVARATPIGSLSEIGQFERGLGVYPTTGAEVHALGAVDIAKMFEKFESKGFGVGKLATQQSLEVKLDPSNLFGRHFTILGQTGSGKSWTLASLIQRAVKIMPRSHVVLLDLHGEYHWRDEASIEHFAFDETIVRHVDARDLEIPYWLMTYSELVDLLVDRNEQTAHNQIAFFRDTLRDLRELEKDSLNLDRVTVDTPVYFSLDTLLQRIEAKNSEMVDGSRGPKQGPMFGSFDRFITRLHSRLNDIRYDFLFKPKVRTNSRSMEALLRDFIGLGEPKCALTIIDLSSVPFDVRPTVAAQVGRLSFEFNYWNPKYREFPLLLLCEEAHVYIPRSSSTQYAGSRKSMERIAKEGRKYGVGLGIISQRPHEISETVLAQCGTFICMRITNPADQSYVSSLVPEAESDLVNVLAGLGRGEALILGEGVPLPSRVQFYKPNPAPNSEDIDFYKMWREGPEDLDVGQIVNRWRKQER